LASDLGEKSAAKEKIERERDAWQRHAQNVNTDLTRMTGLANEGLAREAAAAERSKAGNEAAARRAAERIGYTKLGEDDKISARKMTKIILSELAAAEPEGELEGRRVYVCEQCIDAHERRIRVLERTVGMLRRVCGKLVQEHPTVNWKDIDLSELGSE